MKMSDYFDLPATAFTFGSNGLRTSEAAAHAVNCHDDLVAALEEIVAACKQRGEANDPNKFWEATNRSRKALQKAHAALAKARGEG